MMTYECVNPVNAPILPKAMTDPTSDSPVTGPVRGACRVRRKAHPRSIGSSECFPHVIHRNQIPCPVPL
jgi:hypothetical protein